jgi:hypothetical protein
LAVDGNGNVYVTGASDSLPGYGQNDDYATIKYNSAGVQQWVARYNGPGNDDDLATGLAVDGNGNVYVTGASDSLPGYGQNYDYATIKYNSAGVQQWVANYNGPGNGYDGATSLAVDGNGNVYVTGCSYGIGTSKDYATIKYDSTGDLLWIMRYNGLGNDWDGANDLAVDENRNVYVTGNSLGSGTETDYVTIKYSQPQAVDPWMSQLHLSIFLLHPSHPNPFNPSTAISYKLQASSNTSLKIYDTAGRLVATLVEERQMPGEHQVHFDGTDLPSGIYIARLQAGEFTAAQKLVLLK